MEAIFTNRSVSLVGDRASQAYGVDGVFNFHDHLELIMYYAQTTTPGGRTDDASYQGKLSYNADRYGLVLDHLVVEDHFIPEVRFVRRGNFRLSQLSGRFSPRPASIDRVRRFAVEGTIDYHLTADTPFDIGPDVTLPIGEYAFTTLERYYELGGQRRVSGTIAVRAGSF